MVSKRRSMAAIGLCAVRNRQRGISLLEVLAAMVILSAGATVAFTWFSQSAVAMGQVKSQEAELLARNEALEYLQHLNIDTRPEGQVSMEGFLLKWSSRPTQPQLSVVTDLGMPGSFSVSLHEVDVVLLKASPGKGLAAEAAETEWVRFQVFLPGYTRKQNAAGSVFGSGRQP